MIFLFYKCHFYAIGVGGNLVQMSKPWGKGSKEDLGIERGGGGGGYGRGYCVNKRKYDFIHPPHSGGRG